MHFVNHNEIGNRVLTVFIIDNHLIFDRTFGFADRRTNLTLALCGHAQCNSPVQLADIAALEHFPEPAYRFGTTCQDQNARCFLIKTVHQTRGYAFLICKHGDHTINMALLIAAALCRQTCRLIQDHKIAVIKNDTGFNQLFIVRAHAVRRRLRFIFHRRQTHDFSGRKTRVSLGFFTVHLNRAFTDKLLRQSIRKLRYIFLQPAIQSLPVICSVYYNFTHITHAKNILVIAIPKNKPPIASTTEPPI